MATIATTLVLIAAAGATQLIQPAAPSGGEVFLEATDTTGQDPFSGTIVVGEPAGDNNFTDVDRSDRRRRAHDPGRHPSRVPEFGHGV